MPQLLEDGLPQRTRRSIDFAQWADGQAWKFVKGEDYTSTTETFRAAVRRWGREHGYEVESRPLPALDDAGEELPLSKTDGIALAVRFVVPEGAAT
ncbi:hypothetical protein VSS74_24625 [Conexibacter stalactiti]|uniref:Uncharacterized protein n=1 Tax=Conexibacter stalactiti TaxID=1940611 RepID=A0ABU4HW53_9ACTN|nr:hypothetical protein [Conexibacter stalactiti]MDW5597558.1 hypothetical protein [Conexibacter stalactiti]MEC5038200.1 hypothetical protein [Conexibacter stalactiti]